MNTTLEIPYRTEPIVLVAPKSGPDRYTLIGYLLLIISFLLYTLVEVFPLGETGSLFSIFCIHYLLALGYNITLCAKNAFGYRRSWRRKNIHKTIILLNLLLISAYALNRQIPVFENSVGWLCALLIITSLTLLSFNYLTMFPVWFQKVQYFILGIAGALYLYLMLMIGEYYIYGSIGSLIVGVGAHVFVPAGLFTACIFIVRRNPGDFKHAAIWISAGVVCLIILVFSYVIVWSNRIVKVERLSNQSVIFKESELPVWVRVAQFIPNDWLTKRLLKSDIVYSTVKVNGTRGWMPRFNSWSEQRQHDPLVLLSTLRAETTLAAEDRIKILKTITNARHNASERLWDGDDLSTPYIVSDIDIYPDLRLAYTEKYINIRNKQKGWRNDQEAIYTFILPEGSVVTSLSLWIDGVEAKGILTSRQNAAKAYNTIVGVQRRDPSIVNWQEGNSVTVRVFPCTSESERKFKLGITSPLLEKKGKLHYQNISFEGPEAANAKETIRVRFQGQIDKPELPAEFKADKKGNYLCERAYDPDFEIAMKSVPLRSNNRFYFDGYRYTINKYEPITRSMTFNGIYLDINNSWTDLELNQVLTWLDSRNVFVYSENEFVKLSRDNAGIARDLAETNFSLFPFHLLKDPEHTLVVTKGNEVSPHLSDFRDSPFGESLHKFFAAGKKVCVYNLEGGISPYISSLRDLRAIDFEEGSVGKLISWISIGKFSANQEDDQTIVLHDSRISITKQKDNDLQGVSNAPDHLARLFAYNHIMKNAGAGYFMENNINQPLVDEAIKAYVVSPVSSLIVLETAADYEKFNIKETDNSLLNASRDSSGAVPEPHEWALIILFISLAVYLMFRSRSLHPSL